MLGEVFRAFNVDCWRGFDGENLKFEGFLMIR